MVLSELIWAYFHLSKQVFWPCLDKDSMGYTVHITECCPSVIIIIISFYYQINRWMFEDIWT